MRVPTREEALQWLSLTGRSQSECLDELVPDAVGDARKAWERRLRVWVFRDRQAGKARVAAPLAGPAPEAPTPPRATDLAPPEVDLTSLSTVERLEWQVRWLGVQLARAHTKKDARAAAIVDRRLTEAGEKLDRARELEARTLKLDKTIGGVAEWLAKRSDAILLRDAMRRRRDARAAAPVEEPDE